MSIPSDPTQNKLGANVVGAPCSGPYHRPDQPESRPVGVSADGPALVIQAHSVRHLRKTICLAVLAFTIGSLAIVLNSPLRSDFLAPGPLTNSHAQILGGLQAERCQACHESGEQTVAQWLAGSLTGDRAPGNPQCQSDLCLKCHQESLKSDHPMNPHGMPTNDLAMITQRSLAKFADGKTIQVAAIQTSPATEIACSVCHREHHGKQFNLAAMTDKQCQVCHTSTMHRFDLDHPGFAIAANSAGAALNFDHFSHGTRHFSGANRTFECKSCHPADPSARNRVTTSYEQACASCHNPPLVNSQSRGIELVSLPVMDVEAMQGAGLVLKHWPANATGDFDGRMPPLTRLLLSADPELQQIVNKLPDMFQFSDIDPRRKEDLQLAGKLAAGYERLFLEISVSGKSAIYGRLNRVTKNKSANSSSTITEVFLELDDDMLKDAIRGWMPMLALQNDTSATNGSLQSEINLPTQGPSPLMRRKPHDGELLAENPIGKLLQKNVTATELAQPGQTDSLVGNSQAASTGVVVQQASPEGQSSLAPGRSDTLQQAANKTPAANMAGELLSPNPLNSSEFRRPTVTEQVPAVPKLSSDTELSGNLAESRSFGNASPKQIANRSDQLPADSSFFSSSRPQSMPGHSGWKRDDNLMIISWVPNGHADRTIRLMLEWIGPSSFGVSNREGISQFAKAFASDNSTGQCAQCHRMSPPTNGPQIAWRSPLTVERPREFTRFDHAPHLLIRSCESCHQISEIESGQKGVSPFRMASWKKPDALNPESQFTGCGLKPVKLQDCTSCHRPNAAPAGCTTCHNYHVSKNPHGASQPKFPEPPNQ